MASSDDDNTLDPAVQSIPGIAALVLLVVLSIVVMFRTYLLRQRLRLQDEAALATNHTGFKRPTMYEVFYDGVGSMVERGESLSWDMILVSKPLLLGCYRLPLSWILRAPLASVLRTLQSTTTSFGNVIRTVIRVTTDVPARSSLEVASMAPWTARLYTIPCRWHQHNLASSKRTSP